MDLALATATLWACLLPSVNQSIYFHRVDLLTVETVTSLESEESKNPLSSSFQKTSCNDSESYFAKVKRAYYLLWEDFVKAYTNKNVIKWSLWWAFATCGYLQVIVYIQLLWENAIKSQNQSSENPDIYNGFVEALYTIISKNYFIYLLNSIKCLK
jgi:thiamine transporter 2/3